MAHVHSVSDADAHFLVDPIKRVIKSKAQRKITVVQKDHNSERITFELEKRIVEGHDMASCDVVEVHYNNGGNRGIYIVDDLRVSKDDEGKVTCSWLISNNATQKVGPLEFSLTFKCVTGDVTDYVWSTSIFRGISVVPRFDNSETVEKGYPDAISQLSDKVDALMKGDATVTQTADGAVISITHKYATTTATVKHGKEGEKDVFGTVYLIKKRRLTSFFIITQ